MVLYFIIIPSMGTGRTMPKKKNLLAICHKQLLAATGRVTDHYTNEELGMSYKQLLGPTGIPACRC